MNITCEIAYYADDNHLYYENKCHDVLKNVLENDVNTATVWFDDNYICENPDKFPVFYWSEITFCLRAGQYNTFGLIDKGIRCHTRL